jgi:hypothetical protein
MRVLEIVVQPNIASLITYYDQVRVYKSATDSGVFTLLGTTVTLVAGQTIYNYIDNDGLDTDFYKFTYYKSTATIAETAQYAMPAYYVFVQDLKDALDETTATSKNDAVFARCVAAATQQVTNYCLRKFHQKIETRYFEGPDFKGQYAKQNPQKLFLADDVVSISAIQLDYSGGLSGTSLTTLTLNTHCYLWPQEAPQRNEPYAALSFIPTATFPTASGYPDYRTGIYWPKGYRAVRLTGMWGWPQQDLTYSPVPAPVREATMQIAARIYKGRDNAYSRVIGTPDIGTLKIMDDLFNKDVKALLADYRKVQNY